LQVAPVTLTKIEKIADYVSSSHYPWRRNAFAGNYMEPSCWTISPPPL
jgi:hypothetical protein